MSNLAHIADRVLNTPLLLLPSKAETILAVLAGRIGVSAPEANRFEGDAPPQRDAEGNIKRDMWGDPKVEPYKVSGSTAIITITGSLVNRGAWVGASSGLTSYEGIQHQLKRAAANAEVKSIILDLHSPGGEAVGAFETAALVREIAAKKPVTALVAGMAASAAYAIASGATEIVTTETGVSGSIGVVLLHADYSRALANDGIKPTLIFAGSHKVDGNPFEPLSDAVQSDLQAEVNAFYEAFLSAVAAGRGSRMTVAMARATEARTMIGEAAVKAGLADRVGTFDQVLQGLNSRAAGRNTPTVKGNTMEGNNGGAPSAENNAGITQAQLDAAVANAVTQANAAAEARLAADRERMTGLDGLAAKCAGNAAALRIIGDAKTSGASVADTALALVNAGAFTGAAVLGAIQSDDASASGATPAAAGSALQAGQVPQTEDGWKAEYAGSAALQAEFVSAATYVAFKKAEAAGQVRVLHGKAGR